MYIYAVFFFVDETGENYRSEKFNGKLFLSCVPYVASFSGLSILIASSMLSNVYFILFSMGCLQKYIN